MFRKFIAVLLLLIGLLGVAVSVTGVVIGRQAIDELGTGLDTALSRTLTSLDTAGDTLILTKSTFDQVTSGLETVGDTADNVAQSLIDTQPMLERVGDVAAGDVPDSLEAIEGAIPAVADAAGTIDDTLRTLSEFEVERTVFGIPIEFDLGIDYDPVVALDDSVLQIGRSLEGMPEVLRDLQTDLDVASDNLETVSSSVGNIATDLDALGSSVERFEPLVDDYIQLIQDLELLVEQTRERLDAQLETAKLILTLLFVWVGLNQLIPLYLSWDIFRGDREENDREIEISDHDPQTEEMKPEEDERETTEE
jgi:methyl-accepting chemotaxis protein